MSSDLHLASKSQFGDQNGLEVVSVVPSSQSRPEPAGAWGRSLEGPIWGPFDFLIDCLDIFHPKVMVCGVENDIKTVIFELRPECRPEPAGGCL